jgi:alpha-2-macroglobulin
VSVRPRLADGLKAVADYMRRYPYGCMEQKVSAAVALRDPKLWERWAAEVPAYMDEDGLVKYFPSLPSGDPVLTAYLLAVSRAAGWAFPGDLPARMTAGLRRFVEGRLVRPSPLPAADLTVRKLAAMAALGRAGAAEPALIGSLTIEPNLWPTSAVIDWIEILLAMPAMPQRQERLAEAEQVLRGRLTYQGERLAFSTEASDGLGWLMVSSDLNAVRLILTALQLEGWQQDLPQLVRGALARQRHGHWDLTTANAWGVLAMERFSERFEAGDLTGTTRVGVAGQDRVVDWDSPLRSDSLLLAWPPGSAELAVEHQGAGKPWLSVQGLAALPLKEPLSSGYTLRKTVSAVERRDPDRWSRGDVLRVRIEIEAQADMTWVAVSDPVPAGGVILGAGLGRDSRLLAPDEERRPRLRPAYEERSFEAFRAYYEVAPRGRWAVEYALRLNQPGTFSLPPTRVEALYAPEVFGEIPNERIEVLP